MTTASIPSQGILPQLTQTLTVSSSSDSKPDQPKSKSEPTDDVTDQSGLPRHTSQLKDRKTIRLNVGGQIFEVFRSTILSKPKTRLCWLMDDNAIGISHEDIEYRSGELFFDRDPLAFNFILQYYRTGKLHSPLNLCGPAFQEELKFWQIDEDEMESCCWPTYESHMQAAETIKGMMTLDAEKQEENEVDYGQSRNTWKSPNVDKFRIFLVTMFSESSTFSAKVYHIVSAVSTITSVLVVSLISMPELRHVNGTESRYIFKPGDFTVRELLMSTEPNRYLLVIDLICNIYFLVEFLLLFIAASSQPFIQFFKNGLNLIDLINNLIIGVEYIKYLVNPTYKLDWSNWFYFARTTRIVRLMRHISGLEVIFYTFKASLPELTLLMSLFMICVVLLGTTLYLCEQFAEQPSNKITHIPISYYWAVISLTTVGYGDYSPTSPTGYLVGILTAIMGILVIVLPVPIIANNFCLFYAHAQAKLRKVGSSHAHGRVTIFG